MLTVAGRAPNRAATASLPNPSTSAAVELHGDHPYTIITTATTVGENESVVRLTVALPRMFYDTEGLQAFTELLIQRSRRGLERDRLIWENLNREVSPAWTREDAAVREFYRFCQTFLKRDPIGSRGIVTETGKHESDPRPGHCV